MSKRLTHELTYDAPLADVAAMLRDPAFRDKVCERQRVLDHDVTVTRDGDSADITVERLQAVEGVPAIATKVVGDQITIVHRENWHDLTSGDYTVTIPGKPGQIAGTVTLTESGGLTVETVDLEVTVNVPLVSGKLEGIVIDLLKAALRTEHEVGVAHLAR